MFSHSKLRRRIGNGGCRTDSHDVMWWKTLQYAFLLYTFSTRTASTNVASNSEKSLWLKNSRLKILTQLNHSEFGNCVTRCNSRIDPTYGQLCMCVTIVHARLPLHVGPRHHQSLSNSRRSVAASTVTYRVLISST
jgi:hypothetical protein